MSWWGIGIIIILLLAVTYFFSHKIDKLERQYHNIFLEKKKNQRTRNTMSGIVKTRKY